jgi:membrane peptidoglycan carboxypeptidase
MFLGIVAYMGFGRSYTRSVSAPLRLAVLPERSVVFDHNNNVIDVFDQQNRTTVNYKQVPSQLINAVVDTEDHTFFLHGGLDVRSLLRAAATDVASGGARQGGSTITQQLVKNTLLNQQKTISRKVHEAIDAVRLENTLTKQQILGDYLNTVYFGNGAYGVEAAAETYFGTTVSNLDVAQSALLAGVIQDPGGDDPILHPADALARRATVLALMERYHHLTPASMAQVAKEPLPTALHGIGQSGLGTGFFNEEVRQRLLADPAFNLGDTPSARAKTLQQGGLRIYTTMDPSDQTAAEVALQKQLPDTKGKFTGALVSIDPTSGAIRALAVGTDFAKSQVDIVTGRGGSNPPGRQVGSSFKPFTLLTAVTEGISPKSTVDGSAPCQIDQPGYPSHAFTNFEGEAFAQIDLTTALANSVNCAYERLYEVAGPQKVAQLADQMLGLPRPTYAGLGRSPALDPVPSLTLGPENITPLQMASAYATLDNDGVRHEPFFVSKITDAHGRVIFRAPDTAKRIVSAQDARTVVQAMEAVVSFGTGTRAAISGHQVAGKTGTTENFGDAWFVGFSRQLTTAVWMGSPQGEVPMRGVGGVNVAGGTFPAQIWHAYMTAALAGQPSEPLPGPDPAQIPAPVQIVALPGQAPTTSSTTTSTSTTSTTVLGGSTTTTLRGGSTTTTTPGETTTSTTSPKKPPTTSTTIGKQPPATTATDSPSTTNSQLVRRAV